jgi:hypothetical protein
MINHRPITHQRGGFGYKRNGKNIETKATTDSKHPLQSKRSTLYAAHNTQYEFYHHPI